MAGPLGRDHPHVDVPGRDDLAEHPMDGIVRTPVDELFQRMRTRRRIDRNDDGPFQALGAVDRYDRNRAIIGIRYAFDIARPELGMATALSALPLSIPIVLLLMRKLRTTEVQL